MEDNPGITYELMNYSAFGRGLLLYSRKIHFQKAAPQIKRLQLENRRKVDFYGKTYITGLTLKNCDMKSRSASQQPD